MFCNTSRAFFLAIVAVTAGTASHALMDGPWLNLPTFSGDLTRELYTNPNDCTSVWGLSMMFDLLGPGTDNEKALSQFCDVIGLCYNDGDKQLLWNDTVAQWRQLLNGTTLAPNRHTLYSLVCSLVLAEILRLCEIVCADPVREKVERGLCFSHCSSLVMCSNDFFFRLGVSVSAVVVWA